MCQGYGQNLLRSSLSTQKLGLLYIYLFIFYIFYDNSAEIRVAHNKAPSMCVQKAELYINIKSTTVGHLNVKNINTYFSSLPNSYTNYPVLF